jgi:lactoylglutathione lyase
MGLLHAAINVSDVEQSIAFYRSIFDMNVLREQTDERRQVWLGRKDEPEIQLCSVGPGTGVGSIGVNHIAIGVEDVDKICDALDSAQIEMEPETFPSYGTRAAFIKDPDGYTYELIQELD